MLAEDLLLAEAGLLADEQLQARSLAFSLLAAAAVSSAADAASDVTQLTKATFDEFIASNDLVLAECKCPCARRFGFLQSS